MTLLNIFLVFITIFCNLIFPHRIDFAYNRLYLLCQQNPLNIGVGNRNIHLNVLYFLNLIYLNSIKNRRYAWGKSSTYFEICLEVSKSARVLDLSQNRRVFKIGDLRSNQPSTSSEISHTCSSLRYSCTLSSKINDRTLRRRGLRKSVTLETSSNFRILPQNHDLCTRFRDSCTLFGGLAKRKELGIWDIFGRIQRLEWGFGVDFWSAVWGGY